MSRSSSGSERPREELFQRIDQRIDLMLADGFVKEVKGLLDAGYASDLPTDVCDWLW